jgi:hypothetical protein
MATRDELRAEARRELARRELARRDFGEFCRYVLPVYPDAAHLHVLAGYLQEVERYLATSGEDGIGRLMVNMPPQYWKSTTATVLFPAWLLGRHPEKRGIVTGYNASLAVGFSRRARETVEGEAYQRVFGEFSGRQPVVTLARESRSAESWNLAGFFGGVSAAGVGGGITGKTAHFMIIDDPHKDRADAESELSRAAVWDWYISAVYTRLQKGSPIIVIQTRWHSDDLSGRLLKAMAADPLADAWTVLSMPAVAPEVEQDLRNERIGEGEGEGEAVVSVREQLEWDAAWAV